MGEALLIAIAKARNWVDDLAHGRAASFAAIARRDGKVERHVRLLAQLAFVSPRIVAAILDATAPAGLTVTARPRLSILRPRYRRAIPSGILRLRMYNS
jgi:hypothetical protein